MEDPTPSRAPTRRLHQPVPPDSVEPLKTLPQKGILSGLSKRSLENLAQYGRYDRYDVGTEIIHEDTTQDRFYVVVSGELSVSTRKNGKDLPLSVAKPGECLGEVSLLEPGPASATVCVLEDATLWSMDIHDLRVYILDHAGGAGALLMGMASCLSTRLREANQLIARHHIPPVETLPPGRERAITAKQTPWCRSASLISSRRSSAETGRRSRSRRRSRCSCIPRNHEGSSCTEVFACSPRCSLRLPQYEPTPRLIPLRGRAMSRRRPSRRVRLIPIFSTSPCHSTTWRILIWRTNGFQKHGFTRASAIYPPARIIGFNSEASRAGHVLCPMDGQHSRRIR